VSGGKRDLGVVDVDADALGTREGSCRERLQRESERARERERERERVSERE
jgi:hypothetical protein